MRAADVLYGVEEDKTVREKEDDVFGIRDDPWHLLNSMAPSFVYRGYREFNDYDLPLRWWWSVVVVSVVGV